MVLVPVVVPEVIRPLDGSIPATPELLVYQVPPVGATVNVVLDNVQIAAVPPEKTGLAFIVTTTDCVPQLLV